MPACSSLAFIRDYYYYMFIDMHPSCMPTCSTINSSCMPAGQAYATQGSCLPSGGPHHAGNATRYLMVIYTILMSDTMSFSCIVSPVSISMFQSLLPCCIMRRLSHPAPCLDRCLTRLLPRCIKRWLSRPVLVFLCAAFHLIDLLTRRHRCTVLTQDIV